MISKMKEDEKTTLRAAHLIREEVRAMEDVMPWPPQEIDLDEEKVRLSHHLSLFLDKLLNLRFTEQPSPRICRLKSSFGQDIVYAVSRGRIKTPRSIMYPYTIKSLTNCTELIDISSRLGHGINRSLVEELTTENAYRVMDQQNEGTVALPPGSKEETFTIAVYDNIDRQEETLSGKFRVVYHLHGNSGNSGWNVNGTHIFLQPNWKIAGKNSLLEKVVLFDWLERFNWSTSFHLHVPRFSH
jgi:hypothetical protein